MVEMLDGRADGCRDRSLRIDAAGIAASVLLWTLVALTFIDFDTQFLPDNLHPAAALGGAACQLYGAVPSVTLR